MSIEWGELKLGKILEVKYGKDHKNLLSGNIPVYGSGGIMRYVDSCLYEDESILIPRKGTLSNIFYKNEPFWTVDTMFWTKINTSKVLPKFLYYQLRTVDFTNMNVGSAVPSLTVPVINDIDILLPSLQEQKSIAEVLSSLDDKIDLLHRQNKTLEELAETLFRQWFVEEAEDSILSDEFNVIMGQSPPGESYNESGNGSLFYQGRTDFGFRFPTPRVYCVSPTRFADKFDTLMSVRAPVGDLNYAKEKCCIGRGLASIRHKNQYIHHAYTFYTLKTLKDQFDLHDDNGTIFGSISKDELLKLKCIKLFDHQVEFFNSRIGTLDDKISLNCSQIQKLETLRDTLLPKLISGAVRVN
jgi:type I restriction enzyme S subunit